MLKNLPSPDIHCHHEHAAPAASGSRSRRIWDLDHHCHCPLVGVSLPLDSLRRVVNKALGGNAVANDYEVHASAVSEAPRRCKLSELIQAELDARYAREIQTFKTANSTLAVAELWIKYLKAGDVAGAFWAALSHPRCDVPLQEAMCKDLHMFQRQAGAGVRLEMARFNELAQENSVLGRELGKVQERITRVMAQKAADMERLQKQVDQMAQRQQELEIQNGDLQLRLAVEERAVAEPAALQDVQAVVVQLHQKVVLCVGGRSGNTANYRDVVERVGGKFAHHDGGVEDNASVLDDNLAAADLVICQTGCISHNAYWRVKDFCKRTGKRCVFVENPSASSLVRRLQSLSKPSAPDEFPEGS